MLKLSKAVFCIFNNPRNLISKIPLKSYRTMTSAQSVLDYWFEPGKSSRWFMGGKVVDDEIKEKFGDLVNKARNNELSSWENLEDGTKSAFAYIILIDQFCRNIYRGTKDMYSHDHKALAVALKLLENDSYRSMTPEERFFLYLPLEHDENRDIQARCVKLYAELCDDVKDSEDESAKKTAQQGLAFSKLHQAQIEKYGRFPKRNAILERENTPQEEEDLKDWKEPF